jgi:hypothetical protein
MLICLIVGITIVYIAVVVYLHLLPEVRELWDWER